jgi:hypothetical protein
MQRINAVRHMIWGSLVCRTSFAGEYTGVEYAVPNSSGERNLVYPFNPVIDTLSTKYLCAAKNSTMHGNIQTTLAAMR